LTLSTSFLDELRARTTLSTLVTRTVPLKKAGREFRGCCPFHNEKTPSFYVNDEKSFYHCFGCSAHGDAIRWLTDQKGLTFMEAVRELADAAGMEVPAAKPGDDQRDRERDEDLAIMARAEQYYATAFGKDGRRRGIDFLAARGVAPHEHSMFNIGYAPGDIRSVLRNVAPGRLVKLGLLRAGEGGREDYDFFRDRVVFPIHDNRGRCVGFGGRALGDAQPKYLNSPDTPIFDKGRSLYNIHRASPAARVAKRLIVVEGYMDVIALAGAGIGEAVAPNGTALTEAQLTLCWRLVDVPILCFDGDNAGRRAAERAAVKALPMLEPGKSLSFAFPPAGKDPDDILRESGAAAVSALFNATEPLVDVLWRMEMNAKPLTTPEEMAGFWSRMKTLVSTIRHADVRDAYGSELLRRFNEKNGRSAVLTKKARQSGVTASMSTAVDAAILLGMIRDIEVVREHYETIATIKWQHDEMRRAAGVLIDLTIGVKSNPDDNEISAALEAASLPGVVERLRSSAKIPFTFIVAVGTPEAREDLVAAIYRMAK
jgi:DNA primase